MSLTVGSLFAGIGGFDLGFERAGYRTIWQVEQDGKAQSVLSLRFPDAKLHNDVRTANGLEQVDVICGGFPCQDVSVAGKRSGLAGARTSLFWEVIRIARELRPRWMVLENVPGLLSSHGGRDFHTVLSALADCGFRREYRILDSRYFGVAQRRRRVFLVLRARDGRDHSTQVLFESTGSGGDSQTRDEARADVAATLRGRSHGACSNAPGRGGEDDQNLIAFDKRWGIENDNAPTLRADCHGAQPMLAVGVHGNQRGELRTSELAGSLNGSRSGKQYEGVMTLRDERGRCSDGTVLRDETFPLHCAKGPSEQQMVMVPERARALVGSMHKRHDDDTDTLIPTLSASLGHHGHSSPRGDGHDPIVAYALRSDPGGTGQGHNTTYPGGVRRLTPLECERLQGFPDGWTCLCGEGHRGSQFCSCADSPRYRQLGNAVTVPVAEWIARRILEAEEIADRESV